MIMRSWVRIPPASLLCVPFSLYLGSESLNRSLEEMHEGQTKLDVYRIVGTDVTAG